MRDDAAFLIGCHHQWRQARDAPPLLKCSNLGFERLARSPRDIVPGDIDARDEALLGDRRNFLERCVAHHKMLPQHVRRRGVRVQDISLAEFKRGVGVKHRREWQAPQQNQPPSRFAGAPITPLDQEKDREARNQQNRDTDAVQKIHVGLVNIQPCKNKSRTEQPEREGATDFYHLNEAIMGTRIQRINRPYQTCLRGASALGVSAR